MNFVSQLSVSISLQSLLNKDFVNFPGYQYQAIMVKAYNGALILADVLLLILKILYYICESVYKFFVPPEEKSVAGEIVLVCI